MCGRDGLVGKKKKSEKKGEWVGAESEQLSELTPRKKQQNKTSQLAGIRKHSE